VADDEYGTEYDEDTQVPTLPSPENPRIFVVANQKGGVGKTTSTVNVATALAFGGLNVLVIDIDPQGNASTALGIDHDPGTPGTYEVLLRGERIQDLAKQSPHTPNLHVLPATVDLSTAELELVNEPGRESRMKKALTAYIEESGVDYVFFDCPPSLGLLTLNALVASNEIMVPIQCEYYALEGVSQLMRTIQRVKGNLNDRLQLTTVLLTMFDNRTNLSHEVAGEVRAHFGKETLDVEIPRSVRIAEAPSYGQSVLTYYPKSPGAVAYLKAAEEIARAATTEEGAA
jgi:cobQ/cobB/minD/parA nucleotide binding domain protein